MKKLTILFLFLLSQTETIFSQDSLSVYEKTVQMSRGPHKGFAVMIPQVSLKMISSDWKKYLKENSDGSIKEIDGEYFLARTVIENMGKDSMSVRTIFNDIGSKVELIAFYSLNDTDFIAMSSPQADAIKKFMNEFAIKEYKKVVSEELQQSEKLFDLKENELHRLEKDSEKAKDKISDNENDIAKLKQEISSGIREQETASTAIYRQTELLKTMVGSSELKTGEEKKLKQLQKEKEKLEKENEDRHKDIAKKEKQNTELTKIIELNQSENIPVKKAEIQKQKENVDAVKAKLNNIK
jgi:hypothetical protein